MANDTDSKRSSQDLKRGYEPLFLRAFSIDSISTKGTASPNKKAAPAISCADYSDQKQEASPKYQNRFSTK